MKRGQAALEYLLTYGWAILIVIIVGASLYALGVFTPGQWTGKRQTGFSYFRIEDFKLQEGGNLTIFFKNQIGKTVEITDIVATFKNTECAFNYSETISPTLMYNATADCFDEDFRASYSILIDFEYDDPESDLSHIDSGTLFGSVEK